MAGYKSQPDLAAYIRGLESRIATLERSRGGQAAGRHYAENVSNGSLSVGAGADTGYVAQASPAITFDTIASTFVAYFAEFDWKNTDADATLYYQINIVTPDETESRNLQGGGFANTWMQERLGGGTTGLGVVPVYHNGTVSITTAMRLQSGGAAVTGSWRNRRLWAQVVV